MRSSFFGLNVALQGLYTSRTNMDITNHNISNVETKGYSRQYGVQNALHPLRNTHRGMVGTGSEVKTVDQYRDKYLDDKYWKFNKEAGKFGVKSELIKQMELVFNEPTKVGITAYLDKIFSSLEVLTEDPTEYASKKQVAEAFNSFVKNINDVSEQLHDVQNDANFGIKNSVDRINFISEQIASLNQQIGDLELSGHKANDLRDKRMVLVDSLSEIVPIKIQETKDKNNLKTFNISVNGQQLINGPYANKLELRVRSKRNNPEDSADLYDIYWQSGRRFYLNNANLSGKLKGYIDIRDGNNQDNFTGQILSGAGTTTLVLGNVSRHDIPSGGTVLVNGQPHDYTGYSYDDTTGQMTLTLATPAAAGATSVTMGTPLNYKGVPHYLKKLNHFARVLARQFNEIHQSGDSNTGLPLFVYKGYTGVPPLDHTVPSSYDSINSDNWVVNPKILEDVNLIKTKLDAASGESDSTLIHQLIDKRHDETMFATGKPDDYIQSIIGEMAVDARQVDSLVKSQGQLVAMVKNQRLSVSGVKKNEEISNLMAYQQAFKHSARTMQVFDEIYDVIINQIVSR